MINTDIHLPMEDIMDSLPTKEELVENEFNTCLTIQKAKVQLQNMGLKMTGRNTYSNYDYYELKDITGPITSVLFENKLASRFYFTETVGMLVIYSKTGYCKWTTQLRFLERPKNSKDRGILMKEEQAVQTYARRTLWLQALEIVEPVSLELTEQPKNKPKKKSTTSKTVKRSKTDEPPEKMVSEERIKEILDKAYEEVVFNQGKEFHLGTALWTLKDLCKSEEELKACKQSLKTYNL